MVRWQGPAHSVRRQIAWKLMTSVAVMCLAAGCTKTGKKKAPRTQLSNIDYSQQARHPALKPNHPLHIATTHWARQHKKNPKDPAAALNYARNLKAIGSKGRAMEVLARTYQLNPGHSGLASEYGRTALLVGKVQMAEQLLNRARKSSKKEDWKVLSALGTVNSKRGDHKKAQTYYLAALRARPGATSLYNNLALSYALDGRAGDAEQLLKKAIAKGHNTPRVRQNLALVLGLQTKFGEAQHIAQADLSGDQVASDLSYLKSMVKKTKIASAAKPASITKAKAGTVITAALTKAKKTTTAARKTAKKTKAAPVKTATSHKKPATAKAPAARAIQARSKKIGKPAPRVKTASARTRAARPAQPLPWQKKPGAPVKKRKTSPAPKQQAKTPARTLPRPSAPVWSTSVSRQAAASPAPVRISAIDSTKSSDFGFPESE